MAPGFTVLLVCAVQSRRIYSSLLTSASDRFNEPTCIHDYSNPSPLSLDTRNIINKSIPAPFVLGKSGATVPANPDSHPPSPDLAGVKPVINARGRSAGENYAIFEPGTYYHRMPAH